jgi:hypothetical protein
VRDGDGPSLDREEGDILKDPTRNEDRNATGHGQGDDEVQPHGPLIQLASNLWYVQGTIRMPLGTIKRNMIVYRLADGQLLLHSAVALDGSGRHRLDTLGRPGYLVVPHGGHRQDAGFYLRRYPQLKVLAPAAARAKVEEVVPVDGTEEEVLPGLGITVHRVEGLKKAFGENALEVSVDGGKALIVNDVIAGDGFSTNFGLRLLGTPGGKLGIARAVRWVGFADRAAIRASLERLADRPDVKLLTLSHGPPLRERVSEGIRAAAAQV